jgi:hypothetical protein
MLPRGFFMPVPKNVDATAQIVWGPQSTDLAGVYTPDTLNRLIYVWGYEKTTLIVDITNLGTTPFTALRVKPTFGYRLPQPLLGSLNVTDQFELTQPDTDGTGVGNSPVAPADAGVNVMLTRTFARRWEQDNIQGTGTFIMEIDNRGAHTLLLELATDRTSVADNEVTIYAVRWGWNGGDK